MRKFLAPALLLCFGMSAGAAAFADVVDAPALRPSLSADDAPRPPRLLPDDAPRPPRFMADDAPRPPR